MIRNLLLLNGLKSVDVGFFIGCGVVIALIVAVYFLIPVFNKKQYEEQRENLRKRENAFKSNKQTTVALEETAVEETVVDEAVVEADVTDTADVPVDTSDDEER